MSTYEPLPLPKITTITEQGTIPAGYIQTVYANPCDNGPHHGKLKRKPNKDRSAPFRKFFR